MDRPKVIKPIIVFGTGRSGTTVFSEMLFRHKDISFFSNYLEKYPGCPGLSLVRFLFDNSVYRIFGTKKQLYGVSWFNRIIFKPSEAYSVWKYLTIENVDFSRGFLYKVEADKDTKDRVIKYCSMISKLQMKPKLGIKITGPSRLHYLHSLFPDAKFIRIKRRFIPTLSSFLKVDFWQTRGLKELWWNDIYTDNELEVASNQINDHVLFTAFQLKKVIDVTNKELAELNIDLLEIDYEDFTEYPFQVLETTLSWLGLENDMACVNYLNVKRIVNRNKQDQDYFDEQILKKILANLN